MRVNRGSTSGPAEETGGSGMKAPAGGSGGTQGSGSSGGMRAPAGGGTQREPADRLEGRTDRGNHNDEDIGSSASRGGGGGETNTPRRGGAADLDATPDTADHFGAGGGSSGNPDVIGTTDAMEE